MYVHYIFPSKKNADLEHLFLKYYIKATERMFTDGAWGLHYFVCSCISLQPCVANVSQLKLLPASSSYYIVIIINIPYKWVGL